MKPEPFTVYVNRKFLKLLKKRNLVREDNTVLMWGQPFKVSVQSYMLRPFQCYWPKLGYGKPPWAGDVPEQLPPEMTEAKNE